MNGFLLAAWIGCQALDTTTTVVALHRSDLREANPLMANHGFAIRVSVNIFGGLMQHHTAPRQRWVIPTAFAASGCLAGASNLRALHNRR